MCKKVLIFKSLERLKEDKNLSIVGDGVYRDGKLIFDNKKHGHLLNKKLSFIPAGDNFVVYDYDSKEVLYIERELKGILFKIEYLYEEGFRVFTDNIYKYDHSNFKHNSVFVILHSDNTDPIYTYDQKILMSFRWDNTFGFIGGGIDEGESIREALLREVKEEIGLELPYNTNFKHVSSTITELGKDKTEMAIHTFSHKLSKKEMNALEKNFKKANVYSADELNGLCVVNIRNGLTDKLLSNRFSATAKYELKKFLRDNGYFKEKRGY